tara:strand:- start:20 stop:388 length:369 start_codon:yes stop_codon:yes gene_type:complete
MKDAYIYPHKHLEKIEVFHIIEGLIDLAFFNEKGEITQVFKMGEPSLGETFFFRNDNPVYHTVYIHSEFFIFHETTNGPFDPSQTVVAPWAPDENNKEDVKKHMDDLKKNIDSFVLLNGNDK